MGWSWRIGRIAGIDVYVHFTFQGEGGFPAPEVQAGAIPIGAGRDIRFTVDDFDLPIGGRVAAPPIRRIEQNHSQLRRPPRIGQHESRSQTSKHENGSQ